MLGRGAGGALASFRLFFAARRAAWRRYAVPEDKGKGGGNGGGSGGDVPPAIDPITAGLLERLPKSGEVWPEGQRKLWLELLAGSFKLISGRAAWSGA